uniref:Uncharacterized protein n=1 Tax=Leersia perrieri TaxID=77586 RepID=A0A0D9V009_9ORYZ
MEGIGAARVPSSPPRRARCRAAAVAFVFLRIWIWRGSGRPARCCRLRVRLGRRAAVIASISIQI